MALFTTGIQLLLSAWLYNLINMSILESPFTVQVSWIKHFNKYFVGVDGLSIPMVLLTDFYHLYVY